MRPVKATAMRYAMMHTGQLLTWSRIFLRSEEMCARGNIAKGRAVDKITWECINKGRKGKKGAEERRTMVRVGGNDEA